jgi:hypothetical protein
VRQFSTYDSVSLLGFARKYIHSTIQRRSCGRNFSLRNFECRMILSLCSLDIIHIHHLR